MTRQLQAAPAAAPHRSDAGATRFGQRDINGLVLCAEHYGAPYDLLTAALGVQPARLRAITARWRKAGTPQPGGSGPGPGWCWLTPAGMAAAIRLGPVAAVRFAGPDRYWDGCHDFGRLSAREAERTQPARTGPRRDELGTFATLISRLAHLPPGYEQALRALGEGPMTDLVHELHGSGEAECLAAMDIVEGLGYLWPRLQELANISSP